MKVKFFSKFASLKIGMSLTKSIFLVFFLNLFFLTLIYLWVNKKSQLKPKPKPKTIDLIYQYPYKTSEFLLKVIL